MSTLRQRAAQIARTARPSSVRNTRSYGSSHGHHEPPHNVEEPMGPLLPGILGVIAIATITYKLSRPGENGEPTAAHKWVAKMVDYSSEWERRNTLLATAIQQAAQDRHLLNTVPRPKNVELSYPEVFTHGSPYNVPAGHYPNIDNVVRHYQRKYQTEEERKAKKLAAAAAATAAKESSE